MQHPHREEAGVQWRAEGYRGEGYAREQSLEGEKLKGEHDEELADLLVREIKHELQEKASWLHSRFLLGIISLCALVCLFGLLVLAVLLGAHDGNVEGLCFAFIAACIAIIIVNRYFNRASVAMLRHLTSSLPGSPQNASGIAAVFSVPLPIAGKSATITYQGRLALNATSVTMHWGYSNWRDGFTPHWGHTYWNGVTDATMARQHDGTWQATITVPSGATSLNMTFYNQSRIWDNNNNSNYHFDVRDDSDEDRENV